MADPLSMAIAAAAAGKAAESLTGQAGQVIAAIRLKIRERFRGDLGEIPALDAAHGDPSAAAGLARFLDAEFAADPAFRDEIRALWLQAAPAVTDDAVSNVFYGKADKVVQLRDVHGDLNISLPAHARGRDPYSSVSEHRPRADSANPQLRLVATILKRYRQLHR
jgi:hypothetical protein